jgi:DNA primase catalytic subunit
MEGERLHPENRGELAEFVKVKKVRDTSLKRLETRLLTRRLHRVPRLSSKQRDKGAEPAE